MPAPRESEPDRGIRRAEDVGDRLEPETFFESIMSDLVGALSLSARSSAVGEELAQEAMARAWASWDRVSVMNDPRGWVFRVGFNLSNSRFRRRRAERRAVERTAFAPAASPTLAAADSIIMRAALGELSKRQREVIVARYYLHLDVEEAAELLDIGAGSIKTHTHRGIAKLRRLLGPDVAMPIAETEP